MFQKDAVQPITTSSPEDDELRALVESLKIKISIIGCGGGCSNTVRRMYQGGV